MKSHTSQLKALHSKSTPPHLSASGIRSVTRNPNLGKFRGCPGLFGAIIWVRFWPVGAQFWSFGSPIGARLCPNIYPSYRSFLKRAAPQKDRPRASRSPLTRVLILGKKETHSLKEDLLRSKILSNFCYEQKYILRKHSQYRSTSPICRPRHLYLVLH